MYSAFAPGNVGGESERAIGKWLSSRGGRERVLIATKCGLPMGGAAAASSGGLSARWIVRAVEDSLQRLQTDYIDLYQAHRDDPAVPLDESLAAFDQLLRAGKVRAIGASNYSAARLQAALNVSAARGLARFETLQPLYNLYDRFDFEGPLAQLCVSESISVIPYYSLAAGFLSGKYRSRDDFNQSARGPGMERYLDDRGLRIVDALWQVARQRGCKPAQVAIAWLLTRPGVTAPIVSATSLEQLATLSAAARMQLAPAEISLLTHASDRKASDGDRATAAH